MDFDADRFPDNIAGIDLGLQMAEGRVVIEWERRTGSKLILFQDMPTIDLHKLAVASVLVHGDVGVNRVFLEVDAAFQAHATAMENEAGSDGSPLDDVPPEDDLMAFMRDRKPRTGQCVWASTARVFLAGLRRKCGFISPRIMTH